MIFSRKTMKPVYSTVQFNDSPAAGVNIQKHLGLLSDEKLNFSHHIKKLGKDLKGVNVIKKLSNVLLFIKPHLDYGDIQQQSMQYEPLL